MARGKGAAAGGAAGLLLFERGRAVPRSDSGLWLELLGASLAADRGARVCLVGHANLRESERGAELLGLARANAVAEVLVRLGARREQIETASRGSREPLATREGKSEPALGRRVDVLRLAAGSTRGAKRR